MLIREGVHVGAAAYAVRNQVPESTRPSSVGVSTG
jgi:hypothetical protein